MGFCSIKNSTAGGTFFKQRKDLMKSFKILLLSFVFVLFGFAINIFAMEKEMAHLYLNLQTTLNDANVFLNQISSYDVAFSLEDQDIVVRLFSACQSNDVSEIRKVVTILNKKNNADELVCMTLFFAAFNNSEVAAENLLKKKPLRIFIFRAFLPEDQTNSIKCLRRTVEYCVQVGHFSILTSFINQILLKTTENDKHKELPKNWDSSWISSFVDDCEDDFKDVLKIVKERNDYESLFGALEQLNVTLDESDEDEEAQTDSQDESGQDYDDDDSLECSSDKDSDGECFCTRGWRNIFEYLLEHQDDLN